jgi:GDPmannose 4,6-dehydratase
MQWMMLQRDKPQDFVIATGVQHSVRDFITWTALRCAALRCAALRITLRYEGRAWMSVP